MLTAPSPRLRYEPQRRTLFWCEATATIPMGPRYDLGAHTAATPRLALRWFRARVQDVADQLDPPGARPGRHWLTDHGEHERALTRLRAGHPYTFTLFEDTTRYVLTIRPVS